MDPAREKLVTDNMNLVHFLAKKFLNTGMEYDDIVSVGYVGLVKAAGQFDENRGSKFSTFAGPCITNEILSEARKIRKWNRIIAVSMEECVYGNDDGNELTLLDMLPCEETGYREFENADWGRCLKETDRLSDKERTMLFLWMAGRRQNTIADRLGCSQSYVSRMIKSSARKLYESNLIGGVKAMDPIDTYAVLTVVCGFLAMMLYEAGMFCTATVLCVVGVVCVILAYCSCASGRRRRKRKRR